MSHRVLVIDDSAVVRRALTLKLDAHPDITVVGAAPDPYAARELIAELRPDVLTLDIEMPRMDGLTFLRKLMEHHPIPTIVVSSITPEGCELALACLEAGAVAVMCKPTAAYDIGQLGAELSDAVREAAGARVRRRKAVASPPREVHVSTALPSATHKIIAIGSSTGGTEALMRVIPALPRNAPGTLIVQHMPGGFTTQFAKRMNDASPMEVREARHGDLIGPGLVLLAPGGRHMRLVRDGAVYRTALSDDPPITRHRPSVDALFHSVAQHAGNNATGVILTGMGSDGAEGMLAMHNAGGFTIAEAEETCVVFGMPRAAIERGGASVTLPLDRIPAAILNPAASKAA